MDILPLLTLPVLLYKLIDFVRYAVNGDRNGVITQLLVWVAGIVGVVAFAHSDLPDMQGLALHQMNVWTQIIVGLQAASIASAGKDVLKAVDNHNSVAIPTLLPVGPSTSPGRHRSEG